MLQIDVDRVEIDYDGRPTWVEAHDLPDLAGGEYVVVYAGQALERMESGEAEEMLAWYANLESMLEQAAALYPPQPHHRQSDDLSPRHCWHAECRTCA